MSEEDKKIVMFLLRCLDNEADLKIQPVSLLPGAITYVSKQKKRLH